MLRKSRSASGARRPTRRAASPSAVSPSSAVSPPSADRPVTSRKQENADATRQALIRAGFEVFGDQGFAAAGVGAICAAAGVTTGALYHHFGDKSGLFAAVAEELEHRLARDAASAARTAKDPWQGLIAGVQATLEASRERAFRRITLEDAPSVLGAMRWREIRRRTGLGHLKEALAALQRRGLVQAGDPEVLASLVIGLLIGAAETLADVPDDERRREAVTRMVTRMLAPLRRA
jgi:AcrR family transcriptional regulator